MRNYKKLTKAELIEELEKLESQRQAMGVDEPERLLEELRIHQVELEMQNQELREAQQELEESRNRYADLYDFAPVGYVSLDGKGVILQINLTGSIMLGMEREKLIGMPFSRYVQPEDRGTFMGYMSECERAEEMLATELRLAARGKPARDVELSCATSKRKPGEAAVYRAAITDITERKRAKEILQESEEYYRSLFENAYDIILVLNSDGTYKYSSPSMKRFTGHEPKELEYKNVFELIHPDDVQDIFKIVSQAIQEPGYTAHMEFRLQHRDSSWHIYEAVGMNLLDDPAVSGVVINAREITERKQLEAELERSREYYRTILENSQDMVIILESDASIRYVSSSVKQILGYRPEEVTGKSIFDFIHPKDVAYPMEVLKTAAKNPGKPYHIECRCAHADGSWRHIETIGVNQLDNPSIGGLVLNSRHVTERKRLEEALMRSEKHFRSLMENAYDVTVVMDQDGIIRFVSNSVTRIVGYEPGELVGMSVLTFIHPDDISEIMAIISAKGDDPITDFIEFRWRNKDGSWRKYEGVGRNLLSDPAVEGVVINYRDVTEREWLLDTLKQSERYYRSLIEHAYDMVIIANADGTTRFVSPSAERIIGYEQEELTDKSIFDYINHEDLPAFMKVFSDSLKRQGSSEQVEYCFLHKDHSWRIFEAVITNLTDDPAVAGMVINFHDITQQNRLQEELRNLSLTDEITGLNNRRGFLTLSEQYLKIAKRLSKEFLLIFADIDGLKNINDTFGHDMGSRALIEAADVFRKVFRESDIMARFGGDEFAILATSAQREDMRGIRGRLQAEIEASNKRAARPFRLSISFGMECYDPERSLSLEDLLKEADALMYESKRNAEEHKEA